MISQHEMVFSKIPWCLGVCQCAVSHRTAAGWRQDVRPAAVRGELCCGTGCEVSECLQYTHGAD